MNNTFQTIRFVAVLAIALFAFADSALAAPVLVPVVVSNITSTSATLDGYVSSQKESMCVWFEWSVGTSMSSGTPVERQCFFNEGPFKAVLSGLTPGTTYSYRAAAMSGGVFVYTTPSTFQTVNPNAVAVVASSGVTVPVQTTAPVASTVGATPVVTQKSTVTTTTTDTKQTVVANGANGFTNGNSAAVIGAGNGMLPTTLIGWIALLIMILIAVIVGHMIYESVEKRQLEKEKKEQEELERAQVATA